MSGPDTVTVTLPRMEDYADEAARASRMMQAAQLAGELSPGAFSRWMEWGRRLARRVAHIEAHGRMIKAGADPGQRKEEAPNVGAGKHDTQGA